MEFYTASSEKRPVRLCETTRAFAMESLQGRYGDEAMQTPYVSMDDVAGFAEMTKQEQYNASIIKIASEAPVRICPHETVSGAATLGEAIHHLVPAFYQGKWQIYSVSHLTLDFPTVLFCGVDALEQKIQTRRNQPLTEDQREQLDGMQNVIRAMHIWHERYLQALQECAPERVEYLRRVPFQPARSFREAVQSLWFTFAFTRLCGNWSGIGRIDEMLGGFLQADLERGEITLEQAREVLAGFFIKGCEWIQSDTPVGSGDAQHYQNLVLGGIDADGNEVTNDVTYLVLDIVEELPIGDFPITVRLNEKTPDRLLTRMAEVIRHGGGVIAVYNEPLILRSLVKFGYPEAEARRFANDGCWEVQVPGKTRFAYTPFDGLQVLLNDTLRLHTDTPACFSSFAELYEAFLEQLKEKLESIYRDIVAWRLQKTDDGAWVYKKEQPCSVISLLEQGCIESARSYFEGGPVYDVQSPHIGGAPDVGNSLYAIDRLVFREKKCGFAELMRILQADWDGNEPLRQYVSNHYTYFGNDDDEADAYTVRVLNDFADLVSRLDGRCPIRFPAGISTFGRQIEWASARQAVPFGRRKGEILSGNASPTPGTDAEGATAVIRSYCKIDLEKQTCGAALDVKLYPETVKGENGLCALKGLLNGFLHCGGFFLQLDVMDAEMLRQAQKHPEQYKTLSVRVSGWNARFVTLNPQWQKMIIERTSQNL